MERHGALRTHHANRKPSRRQRRKDPLHRTSPLPKPTSPTTSISVPPQFLANLPNKQTSTHHIMTHTHIYICVYLYIYIYAYLYIYNQYINYIINCRNSWCITPLDHWCPGSWWCLHCLSRSHPAAVPRHRATSRNFPWSAHPPPTARCWAAAESDPRGPRSAAGCGFGPQAERNGRGKPLGKPCWTSWCSVSSLKEEHILWPQSTLRSL